MLFSVHRLAHLHTHICSHPKSRQIVFIPVRVRRQLCGSPLAVPQRQGERIYSAIQNPVCDAVDCQVDDVSNEEVCREKMVGKLFEEKQSIQFYK